MSPFELTLAQIQINLNNRLNKNVKKISVSGCNKPGNIQIVFTIFTNDNNYHLEFYNVKNIRFFKLDGDPVEEQEHIGKYIKTFAQILNMYIT